MEKILVLDFGSQYTHLIASRIRRLGFYSEVLPAEDFTVSMIENKIKGIILSGGPQSVYDENSPTTDLKLIEQSIPILGICYGFQWLSHHFGGEVTAHAQHEYGSTTLTHENKSPLFENIPQQSVFWMSHADQVSKIPDGFEIGATTSLCSIAAFYSTTKKIFGIQFHPEVTHSQYGIQLLKNFVSICQMKTNWSIEIFLKKQSEKLQRLIANKKVILFVSGGVDSTVCFVLLSKIIGKDQVVGLFVDHGLLRKNEAQQVQDALENIGVPLTLYNAQELFLNELKGVYDAEEKREIIGALFLEVQERYFEEKQLDENWILAQGTIYPDTIESGKTKNSTKIKTHHNCIPKILEMIENNQVIEPISDLYKDEVRQLGKYLGLGDHLINRHPFPGPGLAVRILCADQNQEIIVDHSDQKDFIRLPIKSVGVQGDYRTYKNPAIILETQQQPTVQALQKKATHLINLNKEINRCLYLLALNSAVPIDSIQLHHADLSTERIALLQEVDAIVNQALQSSNQYQSIWQFPIVLIPISLNRNQKESIILRPVDSIDAMSAEVGNLPLPFLVSLAQSILKLGSISAVLLDITSKPPATIEWE